jgi:hypothetical protein
VHLGARFAHCNRIDCLEMRGVGEQRQMHLAAIGVPGRVERV